MPDRHFLSTWSFVILSTAPLTSNGPTAPHRAIWILRLVPNLHFGGRSKLFRHRLIGVQSVCWCAAAQQHKHVLKPLNVTWLQFHQPFLTNFAPKLAVYRVDLWPIISQPIFNFRSCPTHQIHYRDWELFKNSIKFLTSHISDSR